MKLHTSHLKSLRWMALMLGSLALILLAVWALQVQMDSYKIPNYLAWHSLLEAAAIVVALQVFSLGWNGEYRPLSCNSVLLGCAFFAVGVLDFSHTMSFVGMADFFTVNDNQKHLYFWLAARMLAAVTLLTVAVHSWQALAIRSARWWLIGGAASLIVFFNWLVIAHQDVLPLAFVSGTGLTAFKKNSEYLIIAIHLLTAAILWRNMKLAQSYNAVQLFGAVMVMAMSEFIFSLYFTAGGILSLLGHLYKFIAYMMIYRALVADVIAEPSIQLKHVKDQLVLALAASNTALWDWDLESGNTYFSPVWKSQLGYEESELANHHDTFDELLHPDDKARAQASIRKVLDDPQQTFYESEYRLRHKNGNYIWFLSRGEKHTNSSGTPIRMSGSRIDIGERKQAETLFRYAVEATPNSMIMVNAKFEVVLTNKQTTELFGYTADELIGQSIQLLLPESLHSKHQQQMYSYFTEGPKRRMGQNREVSGRRKDGTLVPLEVGLNPISTGDGDFVIASITDLTERKQAEEHIRQLANFDSLTGLPNRELLNDRVNRAISTAKRENSRVAVLFLDLDHFKNVNDSLGHRVGDKLLVKVSQRLQQSIRETDTVSRLGGDEFVIMLTGSEVNQDVNGVAQVAAKLLQYISEPYMIDQHELVITPSIGIALFPEDGVDFDQLCQQADTAMYRAKRDGRNGYCFFTDDMQKRSRRRMLLENALHHALSRKQFHLNFQPQFTSDTGQLVGAEVLLRWTHPEYGMVSPAEFIPIAESNGLIIPIGAWVLRTALQQSKTWLNAGMAPMVMAVNVSAVQFRQPNFPEMVSQMLKEIEIPARYLELELTEGVAMGDPQSAIAIMDDLHKRGVRMSIDDFGTGYSSLNYLKKFKIYKLKIDQSFVRDICVDSDDSALVTTIIQMAHSMGMLAIAEGVETQAQWDFLRAHQCDEVQGYLFSKPLPAEKLVTFVQDQALGASEASL